MHEMAVKFNSQRLARANELMQPCASRGGFATDFGEEEHDYSDAFDLSTASTVKVEQLEKCRSRIHSDVHSTKKGQKRLFKKMISETNNFLVKDESIDFNKKTVSIIMKAGDFGNFGLNLADWTGDFFDMIVKRFPTLFLFGEICIDEIVKILEIEVNTEPIHSLLEIRPQIQTTCAPNA